MFVDAPAIDGEDEPSTNAALNDGDEASPTGKAALVLRLTLQNNISCEAKKCKTGGCEVLQRTFYDRVLLRFLS